MRTIEARVTVNDDRVLMLQLPADVEPGEHEVVLVIGNGIAVNGRRRPPEFSVHQVGIASDTNTFRREDMYGD